MRSSYGTLRRGKRCKSSHWGTEVDGDTCPFAQDFQIFVEIWNDSFEFAKNAVQLPTLSKGGIVRLDTKSPDTELRREQHKSLAALWSPHLKRILRPAMEAYIPASLDLDDWSADNIK